MIDYILIAFCGIIAALCLHLFRENSRLKNNISTSRHDLNNHLGAIRAAISCLEHETDFQRFSMILNNISKEITFAIDHINGTKKHQSEVKSTCAHTTPSHILLVEDDPLMGAMICTGLEKFHHEVLHCHNADEAFEAFTAEPDYYDVILTDYRLPTTNGIDFCKKIGQSPHKLPVIFLMSGQDKASFAKLPRSISAVIQKPIDFCQLNELIGKHRNAI